MVVLVQPKLSIIFISLKEFINCVVQVGVVRATLCHTLATPLPLINLTKILLMLRMMPGCVTQESAYIM